MPIDFELTDEQRLIRETARDFADNEIIPRRARERPRTSASTSTRARRSASMGFLGAIVSEEYGGRGIDYRTYGLIVEEVGRGDSSARTVVSVQTSLVCSLDRALGHRGAEAATGCRGSAPARRSAASG